MNSNSASKILEDEFEEAFIIHGHEMWKRKIEILDKIINNPKLTVLEAYTLIQHA